GPRPAEHRRGVPVLASAAGGLGAVVSKTVARGAVVCGGGSGGLCAGALHAVDLAAHSALVRLWLSRGVHPGRGRRDAAGTQCSYGTLTPSLSQRERELEREFDRRGGPAARRRAGQPGRRRSDEADGAAAVSA